MPTQANWFPSRISWRKLRIGFNQSRRSLRWMGLRQIFMIPLLVHVDNRLWVRPLLRESSLPFSFRNVFMVCSGNNAITFNGYVSGTAPQTSANLNFIYIQNPSQAPTIPKMQLSLTFSMSPIAFTKFPISWFSCFYFILFQVLILRAIDIDLQRLLIISKITILVKAVWETTESFHPSTIQEKPIMPTSPLPPMGILGWVRSLHLMGLWRMIS